MQTDSVYTLLAAGSATDCPYFRKYEFGYNELVVWL